MKTLVVYLVDTHTQHVEYFMTHGIFKDQLFDFVIVSRVDIVVPDGVTLIRCGDLGYMFGAWSRAVLEGDRYKEYDAFIFLEANVEGPYSTAWAPRFIAELNGAKLFGSTINTNREPATRSHVQSHAFCMGREALEHLIACKIFSLQHVPRDCGDAYWNYEVRMSREIIQRGWKFGSFLPHYRHIDFRFLHRTPESYGIIWHGDLFIGQSDINREGVIFTRSSR